MTRSIVTTSAPFPGFEPLLVGLKAAADPTRLRLLALCGAEPLSVSELVDILGQSQPRVSRHLKLLAGAGLLERKRDGAQVFYRRSPHSRLADTLAALLPLADDELARDGQRLNELRQRRTERASAYFAANAGHWDALRSLHVDDAVIERALLDSLLPHHPRKFADIGTGTGRMLELFGPHVETAVGIDASREMLDVARMKLAARNLRHIELYHADMTHLPLESGAWDQVLIHQVLHFQAHPAQALAEASRILAPGGRLAVVDFAPHDLEVLRTEHQHLRLGFSRAEIEEALRDAGLIPYDTRLLPGRPLAVTIWLAAKPT
ncbi:MAG: metalloregulator ArsR/SmtB family transcription factor [Alphaproteobacteria bacterium]|nr:metalloregulator ArsR/SmtB family transcription factor [Alphaproteobacteria bacterium]